MESFELESLLDTQPGLDVDSLFPLSPESEGPQTPVEFEDKDERDVLLQYRSEVAKSQMSCRARAFVRRYSTPEDDSDESENGSVYAPSLPHQPTQIEKTSAKRSASPPLVAMLPTPSLSPPGEKTVGLAKPPSPRIRAQLKSKAKMKAKRGGGAGRKGEPRRTQNMVAQKKYRDKRVQAAHLMSNTIINLRAELETETEKKLSPTRRLALFNAIIIEYKNQINELDPTLAAKQDAAVMSELIKEEQ